MAFYRLMMKLPGQVRYYATDPNTLQQRHRSGSVPLFDNEVDAFQVLQRVRKAAAIPGAKFRMKEPGTRQEQGYLNEYKAAMLLGIEID